MEKGCAVFSVEPSGGAWTRATRALQQARMARTLGVLLTSLEEENRIKRRKGCQTAKLVLPTSVAHQVSKAITELF